MNIASMFGFGGASEGSTELPEIFPMPVAQSDFVKTDVINIFSKILTDTLERTSGIKEDQVNLLWDNCVKSESSDGLVTLLAKAMTDKQDLFLVYETALGVIRQATTAEKSTIEADYKARGKSSTGTFISFKNYTRADMIKLYSGLEYCNIASLYKSSNLSKAIQVKIHDLRAGVSLTDSAGVKTQAQAMAKGLGDGKDILMDAKDVIETASPDLKAVQESSKFVGDKRAFYLGMPSSYIDGEQTSGMGSSGEQDQKAVERGLKNYYFSIVKPVVEALFGIKATYKSQDTGMITSSMEVLKTFSMTDNEIVSLENKTKIMNNLLGLPENEVGDAPEKIDPNAVPASGAPVVPGKGAPVPPAKGKF